MQSQPYSNQPNHGQSSAYFNNPAAIQNRQLLQPNNLNQSKGKAGKPLVKKDNSKKLLIYGFSFVIFILVGACVYLFLETQRLNREVVQTRQQIVAQADEQIIAQKKQKNEIADIFDDQAALNDDLVDAQRDAVQGSQDFMAYIGDSIRFIGGRPQFFREFTEEELTEKRNEVLQEINELQKISEENAAKKESNSDRINQIYLEAGEDRNNTANEREGFR